MSQELWELDSDYFEQVVKIKDEHYLLKEASGGAANKWTNFTSKKTILKNGEVVGVNNPAESGPYLISLCMFHCDKEGVVETDGKGNPVPVSVAEIEAWPSRIQKTLFEKILEVSGLKPDEDDEEDGEGKS